jgi:hypothetical protein
MTDDFLDPQQWRDGIEARVGTLEARASTVEATVTTEAQLRATASSTCSLTRAS